MSYKGPNGKVIKNQSRLIETVAKDLALDEKLVNDVITRYFDRVVEQLIYTGWWRVEGILSSRMRREKIVRNGVAYSIPVVKIKFARGFRYFMNAVYNGRVKNGAKVTANNWRGALGLVNSGFKEEFTGESDEWIRLD